MDTNPPSFMILTTLFLSFFFTFMNILYSAYFQFSNTLCFKAHCAQTDEHIMLSRSDWLSLLISSSFSMKSNKHLPPGQHHLLVTMNI